MTLCVALNVLAIIGFIMTFVQCNPVQGQWDPFQYPQTHCWNRAVQIIYACSVSGKCLKIQPCTVSMAWMLNILYYRNVRIYGPCLLDLSWHYHLGFADANMEEV